MKRAASISEEVRSEIALQDVPMSAHAAAELVAAACPICTHTLAVPFFDGGSQPLATLGWPRSPREAQAMPRHPQDFVQCPKCTHVWNRSFRYDAIPYQNNPNRMFNRGGIWQGHLKHTRDLVLERLPKQPTVIDIGCGEGHFVRGLSEAKRGGGRFVGFDPNSSPESGHGVEFHARLFEPLADMPVLSPDAIVIRHVLEHLIDPSALVDRMAWGASALGKPCWLFAEMPCIDRVFTTRRLADFFYEHVAHFTVQSFRTLMQRAGEIEELSTGYDGEVVYGLVKLGVGDALRTNAAAAARFDADSKRTRTTIREQLNELASTEGGVAIWGGTGKGAAFIHQFCADARRFPIVVDSDPDKVGTCVPGTGQVIQFRDVLKACRVGTVIIPTQWRARDIVAEMHREQIFTQRVLIEHDGRLIDFMTGDHPYR